jgi:hypothetical protein
MQHDLVALADQQPRLHEAETISRTGNEYSRHGILPGKPEIVLKGLFPALHSFSFESKGRVKLCCLERDKARFDKRVLVHDFISFFPALRLDDDHATVVAPFARLHKDAGRKLFFRPFPVQGDCLVDLGPIPTGFELVDRHEVHA